MTRWLNVWKIDPWAFPADPVQAATIWTAMTDRVTDWLAQGIIQEWGVYADGSGGHVISDDAGREDFLQATLGRTTGVMPFVRSDVRPVLDVDQATAAIQRS